MNLIKVELIISILIMKLKFLFVLSLFLLTSCGGIFHYKLIENEKFLDKLIIEKKNKSVNVEVYHVVQNGFKSKLRIRLSANFRINNEEVNLKINNKIIKYEIENYHINDKQHILLVSNQFKKNSKVNISFNTFDFDLLISDITFFKNSYEH